MGFMQRYRAVSADTAIIRASGICLDAHQCLLGQGARTEKDFGRGNIWRKAGSVGWIWAWGAFSQCYFSKVTIGGNCRKSGMTLEPFQHLSTVCRGGETTSLQYTVLKPLWLQGNSYYVPASCASVVEGLLQIGRWKRTLHKIPLAQSLNLHPLS